MILRSLAATLLLVSTAAVQAAPAPTVTATAGWVRILPGALPAGGYVTFRNNAERAVSIVGAESSDYAEAMIHRSSTEGGMGRMDMVDAVPLPGKGTVAFSPGGYHVMLMKPKHVVAPGDKVVVTFELSDGQKLPVTMLARPANASGPTD